MVILTIRSNSGSLVSARAYSSIAVVPGMILVTDLDGIQSNVNLQKGWSFDVEAPTKENIRDWVKSEQALSITQDTTGECVTGPLEDGYCSRGTIGCTVVHLDDLV